jgi:SAM-dependent methyltransferase
LNPELDDYRWLTSDAGCDRLRSAESLELPLLRLVENLRDQLGEARAKLVVEQLELRRRAGAKFASASRMFFTAKSLEQATDETIAAYKAARFTSRAAVADLCCGIGGDLLGIARQTRVVGVERDPVLAEFASANLRNAGIASERGRVERSDVAEFDLSAVDAWHLDPDRRPHGGKTTRFELHDPGPETLDRLLAARPDGALKLSPAARWTFGDPADVELEWISRDRECRQLVVWLGELAQARGLRRATRIFPDKTSETLLGRPGGCARVAEVLGPFLVEPDPAVLAADLTGTFAEQFGLGAVSARIPYFVSNVPLESRLAASFEIIDAGPLDRKRLVRILREKEIGALEIKKRGIDLDPDRLRRRLKTVGDQPGALICFPSKGGVIAVLARRWQDMWR